MNQRAPFQSGKLNVGQAYLQIFIWTNLLLVSFLVKKGIDGVIAKANGNTNFFHEGTDFFSTAFFLHLGIYVVLLISVLIFVFRYMLWSPWKIYARIWKFKLNEESTLPPAVIQNGLDKVTAGDAIVSFLYLIIEFYLAYLIVSSIGNTRLLLILIILLPMIDFLPFFLSFLTRIVLFSLFDIWFQFLNSIFWEHEHVTPKWRKKLTLKTHIPGFFLLADAVDFLLPVGLFVFYCLLFGNGITFSNASDGLTHANIWDRLLTESFWLQFKDHHTYMPQNTKLEFEMVLAFILFFASMVVIMKYKNSLERIVHVLFRYQGD